MHNFFGSNLIDWLNGPIANSESIYLSDTGSQNTSDDYDDDDDDPCLFWPTHAIRHKWQRHKYNLKLKDPITVRQCLKYWAQKQGIQSWLEEPNWMIKPIPDAYVMMAAKELENDFKNLPHWDIHLVSRIYIDIIMNDESLERMLPPPIHQIWMIMCLNSYDLDDQQVQVKQNILTICINKSGKFVK